MIALTVVLIVAIVPLVAILAFRRRTAWFLLERRRRSMEESMDTIANSLEGSAEAAWARVPDRVAGHRAGHLIGILLGTLVLAVSGALALYGEIAQAIGTACAFTGGCRAIAGGLDIGLALGLGSVSAVVFWSMVLTELGGFTHFSDWIRPDTERPERPATNYARGARRVRTWGLPVLTLGLIVSSIWVLVQLAGFREQAMVFSSEVASREEYRAFMSRQSTISAQGRFWAVQAVVTSLSAAFGALAIKDFLSLILTTVVFGGAAVLLRAARVAATAVGAVAALLLSSIQDLIHLIEPAAEYGLAQPYEDMGFWSEYVPGEDGMDHVDLGVFDDDEIRIAH